MEKMKKRRSRLLISVLLLAALLSTMLPAEEVKAAESGRIAITAQYNYKEAFAVLNKVNKQRASAGLGALTMDMELLDVAMLRAHELAVYYSHTRPNGEECFTAFPEIQGGGGLAENIAVGYATSNAVMNGWMNSPGHRANILGRDYRSIGVGVAVVDGTCYWAQCFSTNLSNTAEESFYSNRKTTQEIPFDSGLVPARLVCSPSAITVGKTAKALLSCNNGFCTIVGEPKGFTFQSSDESVCTVDEDGIVKGVNAGTATISLLSGSETFSSAKITVKPVKTGNSGADAEKGVAKPKKTSISGVEAGKKKITVRWKRQLTGKPGYQIQYSADSRFKGSKKIITVNKNKVTSKTITKLKAGKKYYVRIRTYKTINGEKVYSAWSKVKSIKTK